MFRNTREHLRRLSVLFSTQEKRQLYLLLFLTLLVGFIEMVGVASVMPFLAVLAKPEVVETNRYLSWAYDFLGYESPQDFLFLLGALVFCVVLSSIAITAFTNWRLLQFTHMRNYSVSRRLFIEFLFRPYTFFLDRNSASLAQRVVTEVGQVIGGVAIPAVQVCTRVAVAVFLFALLFVVDPFLTSMVALVIGGCYLLIYLLARKGLNTIGQRRIRANEERFRAINEAFGGIKDLKVLGGEGVSIRKFEESAHTFARMQALRQIISELPSFGLQAIAFGGMLIIVLYLLSSRGSLTEALPLIGVYAFAAYRLLPALQQIYANVTKIRFSLPALDVLYEDIKGRMPGREAAESIENRQRIPLERELVLENVTYRYPGMDSDTLKSVDIQVPARSVVGIVGETGAGKTTLLDILLGLLPVTRGVLRVDDRELGEGDLREWQNNIGYVPQAIYLSDTTIAGNIAFGRHPEDIDMEKVVQVAKVANLHDFVERETPLGYHTLIGERGVRLSGGQRQRIGIARALYHGPDILILDEATSALDNLTERSVMEAIGKLSGEKTVVIIAHRLSTIEGCDRIYMLHGGSVIGCGSYEELLREVPRFRMLANAQDRDIESGKNDMNGVRVSQSESTGMKGGQGT